MTPRATNLAILGLVAIEFASGFGGFLVGEPSGRWVFWTHSLAGFVLVVLLAWKWRIVTRSFARRGVGLWSFAPLVLGLLFLGALATGLLWSTSGLPQMPLPPVGSVSGLTMHVVLAISLLPFFVVHLIVRWTRPRRVDFASRRAALRHLAVLGGGFLAWQSTGAATRVLGLDGADRRFTGSREEGSHTGNGHPVTNWLTDSRQTIDHDSWRLIISGARQPAALTYRELADHPQAVETALLDCTGGWYTVQRWRGVRLEVLLARAGGVSGGARSVLVRSSTGYSRRFDIADAPELLLATHVEDEPLNASHGAPMRLVAPGKRGYHWVKWVTEIAVSERPSWWQPPLPLQ